jgi:hypothetical protein
MHIQKPEHDISETQSQRTPETGAEGGTTASRYIAARLCLAIGFRTYGVGGAVCVAALVGTGAWGGTSLGGMAGEYTGEKIFETVLP